MTNLLRVSPAPRLPCRHACIITACRKARTFSATSPEGFDLLVLLVKLSETQAEEQAQRSDDHNGVLKVNFHGSAV